MIRSRVLLWTLNIMSFQVLLFALVMTWQFNDFTDLPQEILGEVRAGITPKACVGWAPTTHDFVPTQFDCSPGYAAYGNGNVAGFRGAGARGVQLSLYCCPLPAEDILTNEHTFIREASCPTGYVITGGSGYNCGDHCYMRCTKINSDRYQLGQAHTSMFFRERSLLANLVASGRGSAKLVAWQRIPASLRWGIARSSIGTWDNDGCVGFPYGSLLAARESSECSGYKYRQLQYLDGTPVKMLPDCISLDGGSATEPECIKQF